MMRGEAPKLPPIDIPTCVRWAEHDPLFPYAWTDRLGETFANLDLAQFPGVGHFPHRENRHELCELMWRTWSPSWNFDPALFATSARSFDNADFVPTVIHSYRHRYANAPGDPDLEALETALAKAPAIACPTIVLHVDDDQVEPPATSEGHESHFLGRYERRLLNHIGHCAPAEAPAAVSQAIEDALQMPS